MYGNILQKVCTKFKVLDGRKDGLPLYDSKKSCSVTRRGVDITC